MSSSLTYTFRNRRISPASSRKCCFRSGNCRSSADNSSPRFAAEHLTSPAPDVRRRSAVGICTVTVISSLHYFWKLCRLQCSLQKRFKLRHLRPNRLLHLVLSGQHVGSFQTVAGDAQHGRLSRRYASLPVKFARASGGHPASSLRKDAFRLRQKLNGLDHFRIGNVLSPPATLRDGLDGIVPVRRIANRQRSSQRSRLLRLDLGVSSLYGSRNRRAPTCLRPEKLHRFPIDQSHLN